MLDSITDTNCNDNNYQHSSQNARKSGGFSTAWDFESDPEYQDNLKRYTANLEPEGRPQGHAVANMVKAQIMMDRVLTAGHAPESLARLYATFSRAYHKAYDTFRKLRDDKGPRKVTMKLTWCAPWDDDDPNDPRNVHKEQLRREGDLSDGTPVDPAFDDPCLDRPDTSQDESSCDDREPVAKITTDEYLPKSVMNAVKRAIAEGAHENCENGILRLPDFPGYEFKLDVALPVPPAEPARPVAAKARTAAS